MATESTGMRLRRNAQSGWWAQRLLEPLLALNIGDVPADEASTLRKGRGSDILISPGVLSLKFSLHGKQARFKLLLATLPKKQWESLANAFAEQVLFYGAVLNGDMPREVEEVANNLGLELFVNSAERFRFQCDCGCADRDPCKHFSLLLPIIQEHLEGSLFSYLLFRGITREQFLVGIRKQRFSKRRGFRAQQTHEPQLREEELSSCTLANFWTMKPELRKLSYSIRADELPASLLRRMDALPLPRSSIALELFLEDLYALVARRAQALGLGL